VTRNQAHKGPYLPPEEPQRSLATWLLVAAIIVVFIGVFVLRLLVPR
jgi:hypothetical protein